MTSNSLIEIQQVIKSYTPAVRALDGVSLTIHENEFFTLLGPSGCGKTTLLSIIAGFEKPDAGAVLLDGADISAAPPEKRPVNTVFQSYALFPHMTVLQNVAFGLEMRGIARAEAQVTAQQTLELVMLNDFSARTPAQLSGGQQQRVALARALANRPRVLLLDEPLSALDFKLRKTMRTELKRLQRETAVTFVFVTHDQEEALAMSDRVAVMSDGCVQQIGTPNDIYEYPANRFVADFIGEANLLEGTAEGQTEGVLNVRLTNNTLLTVTHPNAVDGKVVLAIRPERVLLTKTATTENSPNGTILDITYQGNTTCYTVQLDGGMTITALALSAHGGGAQHFACGETVAVHLHHDSLRLLSE
ncbi:MAG: ABC transporter ATP-binding protein [Proteobacteria bacterium]|nr:ABC transporter ATP-binding protein [Pseudomonadota bacterium]